MIPFSLSNLYLTLPYIDDGAVYLPPIHTPPFTLTLHLFLLDCPSGFNFSKTHIEIRPLRYFHVWSLAAQQRISSNASDGVSCFSTHLIFFQSMFVLNGFEWVNLNWFEDELLLLKNYQYLPFSMLCLCELQGLKILFIGEFGMQVFVRGKFAFLEKKRSCKRIGC